MKRILKIILLFCASMFLTGCYHSSSVACKSKGYNTWYCGYQRPQASYRAMLR